MIISNGNKRKWKNICTLKTRKKGEKSCWVWKIYSALSDAVFSVSRLEFSTFFLMHIDFSSDIREEVNQEHAENIYTYHTYCSYVMSPSTHNRLCQLLTQRKENIRAFWRDKQHTAPNWIQETYTALRRNRLTTKKKTQISFLLAHFFAYFLWQSSICTSSFDFNRLTDYISNF